MVTPTVKLPVSAGAKSTMGAAGRKLRMERLCQPAQMKNPKAANAHQDSGVMV
jgi:hypothetical protein